MMILYKLIAVSTEDTESFRSILSPMGEETQDYSSEAGRYAFFAYRGGVERNQELFNFMSSLVEGQDSGWSDNSDSSQSPPPSQSHKINEVDDDGFFGTPPQ